MDREYNRLQHVDAGKADVVVTVAQPSGQARILLRPPTLGRSLAAFGYKLPPYPLHDSLDHRASFHGRKGALRHGRSCTGSVTLRPSAVRYPRVDCY